MDAKGMVVNQDSCYLPSRPCPPPNSIQFGAGVPAIPNVIAPAVPGNEPIHAQFGLPADSTQPNSDRYSNRESIRSVGSGIGPPKKSSPKRYRGRRH